MMVMKSVNESCGRFIELGECRALLHKLMTGEILVAELDILVPQKSMRPNPK